MPEHKVHSNHDHSHSSSCGHTAIRHDDHTDYLHDGHLHNIHEGHVDEHVLSVGGKNPSACTPQHDCGKHEKKHAHSKTCGHETVPHGDHLDYLVDGHLHYVHGDHCDDHGLVHV